MAQVQTQNTQVLAAEKIIKTLAILQNRIDERFPDAGLGHVCQNLVKTAKNTAKRSRIAGRPNFLLRFIVLLVIASGMSAQIITINFLGLFSLLTDSLQTDQLGERTELAQALESFVNLFILAGAAIWFLLSLEQREKRSFVLRHLHELRSFAHIIDMHQLTKDPISSHQGASSTAASPPRRLSGYALARYLDYCSEMLALTGKLAALYGEQTSDMEVIGAVNDIEILTAGIGRKIWQKIMVIANHDPLVAPDKTRPNAQYKTGPSTQDSLP